MEIKNKSIKNYKLLDKKNNNKNMNKPYQGNKEFSMDTKKKNTKIKWK